MKVCFIGHRYIENAEAVKKLLKETLEVVIKQGVNTFYFGSKSEFDDLAYEVVTTLKESYNNIKRVYVRSAYQFIEKFYEEYLLKSYEETYFPPKIENAGKSSYVERNFEMINNSTYCIFYYNENYVPLKRGRYQRNSGTKVAYKYALKKKKKIINLYK